MKRRTGGEWVGLVAAVLVAGVVVTFGVMIVGSFLGLPIWAAVGFAAFGVALIVYPLIRPSASPSPALTPVRDTDREDPK